MTNNVLKEIIQQADTLTLEEQLSLIAHLVERVRKVEPIPKTRPKWTEIRGLVQSPALGEDAQAWISRTRRESDEHRESLLGLKYESSR